MMEQYGTRPGQFPVAERLCRETLSLPCGPHMTDEHLAYVADAVIGYFGARTSSAAGGA
jgi:dTDP-4-amino-4,6-dideoxygalactose transaminase